MDGVAQEWLQTLPPVTRAYVIASTVLSTADYLGYLKLADILITKNTVWNWDKLWRIPLNLLYNGPISVDFATRLYFFSRYSVWLETSLNSSKNFIWMIFILVIMINIYSMLVTNLALIGPILKDILLYIWTKKNTDVEVLFVFFTVKGDWIPWISVLCDLAFMGYFDTKILPIKFAGIIIGHIFWFLDTQIPILHKCESPFTPIWETRLFKRIKGQSNEEQQQSEENYPEDEQNLNEEQHLEEEHSYQEEQPPQLEAQENTFVTDELDEHEISEFMNETDYQRETFDTLRNRNNM